MIFSHISEQLYALQHLLHHLDDNQYTRKIIFLGKASIGAHTRHVIELLKCAVDGYSDGVIDYSKRARDIVIENDKLIAIEEIRSILGNIHQPDKPIDLIVEHGEEEQSVQSTYHREIIYNTEHTIHHLALIRVALREMNLEIVGDDFGIAYSTLKYQASQ